jgi:DNA-binding beta-propeller fold protein YncE
LVPSGDDFADDAGAPGGTFNEPWDVALDADGFIYVADTWNHRIQKFTPQGEFVQMWATFGGTETMYGLWGPRSIVIDGNNRLYVTDTGNKRIVVYDTDGIALGEFGGVGFDAGQFDEPVGLAVNADGLLYVADTWNRRVQSLFFNPEFQLATPVNMWDVYGWYGQSLENKPYIAVGPEGNVFITDPEGYRVIQFDADGNYIQNWGTYSSGIDGFGLPGGVAVDADGGVWVSDAGNNILMHFTMPETDPVESETTD